ncbi:hypothetical protein AYI68_g1687 [Smittium mucronatum]|uniref:Anaphase-promoting complex subunit 4-like WD40 domain-containing protein n=1 Tax=Smittium mucronatum TaxID=133383 RepID=A0A1R0H4V5_9FUNG|nr:hypothetical protein AYI68_g1687 [Smittium mucronatum]
MVDFHQNLLSHSTRKFLSLFDQHQFTEFDISSFPFLSKNEALQLSNTSSVTSTSPQLIIPNPSFRILAFAQNSILKVFRIKDGVLIFTHTIDSSSSNDAIKNKPHFPPVKPKTESIGKICFISSISWRPDGKVLFVLLSDFRAQILDYQTGKIVSQFCIDESIYQNPASPERKAPTLFLTKWLTSSSKKNPSSIWPKDSFISKKIKEAFDSYDALEKCPLNIDGTFVTKPYNIFQSINLPSHIDKKNFNPIVENLEISPDFREFSILFSTDIQNNSLMENHDPSKVYYNYEMSSNLDINTIRKNFAEISNITFGILELCCSIKSIYLLLEDSYNQMNEEINHISLLKDDFNRSLIDNGLETFCSVYDQMVRVLTTGNAHYTTIQFFLSKLKKKELKRRAADYRSQSEKILKDGIQIQDKLKNLIVSFSKYRATLIISKTKHTLKIIKKIRRIIMTSMWLYDRIEHMIILSSKSSDDFNTLIDWLIFAMEDLEMQNGLANNPSLNEDEIPTNSSITQLFNVSRVLGNFFMTKEELISHSSFDVQGSNKPKDSLLLLVDRGRISQKELDPQYLDHFLNPVCNIHVSRLQCLCVEDGIPVDKIDSGVLREQLIELFFDFSFKDYNQKDSPKKSQSIMKNLDSLHLDFYNLFSFPISDSEIDDLLLKFEEIFNYDSQNLNSVQEPFEFGFHSKELYREFNSEIQTKYNCPAPTIIETIDYISNLSNIVIMDLVPSFQELTSLVTPGNINTESIPKNNLFELPLKFSSKEPMVLFKCFVNNLRENYVSFKWGALVTDLSIDRCFSDEQTDNQLCSQINRGVSGYWVGLITLDGLSMNFEPLPQLEKDRIKVVKGKKSLVDSLYIGDSEFLAENSNVFVINHTSNSTAILSNKSNSSWMAFNIDNDCQVFDFKDAK